MSWLVPVLAGAATGVLSGFGVGGGTLLLIYMTAFAGVEQHLAQGINLLFFLPTAAAALLSHARAGRLDRPTLRAAVPAAAAAALAGAWIATGIDVSMLRRPFGIYLLLSGISLLLPRKSKKP